MTKEEFCKDIAGWDNHRRLLWPALEATKHLGLPVVEYGSGNGSTPYLRQYCKDNGLEFKTYDSHIEWAAQMDSIHIEDFRTADIYHPCCVALVDNAPGEMRHEEIAILKDIAQIIVVHDSETAATGYMLDRIWGLFKWRKDVMDGNTGASAISNFVDLNELTPG